MLNKRSLAVHLMAIAAGGVLLLLLAVPAKAKETASRVGSAICIGCHDKLGQKHEQSLHAHAWEAGENGCESCHGPGGEHAEAPSRGTIVSFGHESLQNAEERSAACLECHAASEELTLWDMGEHGRNDVSCADCHGIHGESRPTVDQPEVCFGCHKDVEFAAGKRSHHPIVEGKVDCSDCHNPHGTLSHSMIRAENTNQLCYGCHAEKRGPFLWEHAPVEEDCGICHTPHGSRHDKLMASKIPNLCQDCHDWSRHPGTPYDAASGFDGSTSNRFVARSCLNCHSAIHGSTAPYNPGNSYSGGEYFVR